MKSTTAREFFAIPAPNTQDGYIFIAPGDDVFVGSELYPALPPAFPSGRAVVVLHGQGIGLVDSSKVVIRGDSYTEQ